MLYPYELLCITVYTKYARQKSEFSWRSSPKCQKLHVHFCSLEEAKELMVKYVHSASLLINLKYLGYLYVSLLISMRIMFCIYET